MSIAEFSIRRPVTTIMFFVSMFVVGLIAAVRLPLEALPSITFPGMVIQLPYPGSTPEEVERTLLRPTEEALATLPGIKEFNSGATPDSAWIFVLFSDFERDVTQAASEARERIDAVRDELPDDFRRYFVQKFSTSDQPILKVRLASSRDLTREYDTLDRIFKRTLERVPGVARVDVAGAPPNEVEIAISPERLTAHGVGLNELNARLQDANFSVSAGRIDDGGQRLRVQPIGEITDLSEYRELVIDGKGTRLGDVAEVRLKPVRLSYGRRIDGQPAVGLDIFKERSANLVQVSKDVLAEIERVGEDPALQGVQLLVVDNQGEAVTGSLLELAEAGLIGLVLSILVLYFFLRHWPSTLMVSLAIPICFVMTLGFMYFAGVTLNVLTMMGLLLAVGMLVDNAVVVVESIYQERERMPGQPVQASLVGTRNVAIALTAGTLCHCIVFVPNLFGDRNMITVFMSQIAVTITVSLLASWLVAISLIPMLSARMKTPPALRDDDGLIARMQRRYARLLRWTLEHRGKSVLGILLIVVVSVFPVTQTKFDMFGGEEGGEAEIYYQWNGAYPKERMSAEIAKVEAFLETRREEWGITQVYSYYSEQGWGGTQLKFDDLDPEQTKQRIEQIREGLPQSALAKIGIGREDDGTGGGGGGGIDQKIQFQLTGDSSETLQDIAEGLIPSLSRIDALRDVRVSNGDNNQELNVRVDRERAAAFGFSAEQVSQFVGLALRGASLREFRRDGAEAEVWVRFEGSEDYGTEEIGSFMVRAPDGRMVPLLAMVNIDVRAAATAIQRLNRQTGLAIQANLADGKTPGDARKALEAVLEEAVFPAGYGYTFEGSSFGRDDEAVNQMMFSLLLALIFIYMLMAAVFESLLFPAAIMSGVVFSIFGVFWLFWLTGTAFSIMSFIGILVLMGVVVNNGIVMIEHINNLRRRGYNRTDALVEGSRERLRPILMTMGTAILAMIPISLGQTQLAGDGPPYFPMARAIAGGLAFSTVVSLLFLPTIYAILDDLSANTKRVFLRARGRAPMAPGSATPATALAAD